MERDTYRVIEARKLRDKAAAIVTDLLDENIRGVEYDQWLDIFYSAGILIKEYQRPGNET